jgi:hypothetical protein
VPQPTQQATVDGQVAFSLGAMRSGQRRSIHLYFQVNPTTVAWNRTADVELDDGQVEIAVVRRTLTVYP